VSLFHSYKNEKAESVLCKAHQLTGLNLFPVCEVHNVVVRGEATMVEVLDLIYSRIVEVSKFYQEVLSLPSS
jgi:hypothetical protein